MRLGYLIGKLSKHYAQATLKTAGSGVCRYAIWSFELNGPMSVSTIGCYGEVLPPEGAVGEVWFLLPVKRVQGMPFAIRKVHRGQNLMDLKQ